MTGRQSYKTANARGGRKKKGLSHISNVLTGRSRHFDLSAHMTDFRVSKAWRSAVGESIAKKSEVIRLDGNTLRVTVSSASWATELRYLKDEIMEKINTDLNEVAVTDIVFKAGSVQLRGGAPEAKKKDERKLTEKELGVIEETTAGVKDDALKETIQRAMAADKRSNKEEE